jgi:hypothetical protein
VRITHEKGGAIPPVPTKVELELVKKWMIFTKENTEKKLKKILNFKKK